MFYESFGFTVTENVLQLVQEKIKGNDKRGSHANIFKLATHISHEVSSMYYSTNEMNERQTNYSVTFIDTVNIN
jgi:hypothetical protein